MKKLEDILAIVSSDHTNRWHLLCDTHQALSPSVLHSEQLTNLQKHREMWIAYESGWVQSPLERLLLYDVLLPATADQSLAFLVIAVGSKHVSS